MNSGYSFMKTVRPVTRQMIPASKSREELASRRRFFLQRRKTGSFRLPPVAISSYIKAMNTRKCENTFAGTLKTTKQAKTTRGYKTESIEKNIFERRFT